MINKLSNRAAIRWLKGWYLFVDILPYEFLPYEVKLHCYEYSPALILLPASRAVLRLFISPQPCSLQIFQSGTGLYVRSCDVKWMLLIEWSCSMYHLLFISISKVWYGSTEYGTSSTLCGSVKIFVGWCFCPFLTNSKLL